MTHAHIVAVLDEKIVVDWFDVVGQQEDNLTQWQHVQKLLPYAVKFILIEDSINPIYTALAFLREKNARTVYWRWSSQIFGGNRGISLRCESESALVGATLILARGSKRFERIT